MKISKDCLEDVSDIEKKSSVLLKPIASGDVWVCVRRLGAAEARGSMWWRRKGNNVIDDFF